MMDYSFYSYIQSIPSLSQNEIEGLLELKEKGNPEARKKLIEHHLRLVLIKVRMSFRDSNIPFDDLFQIGSIGVIKAIDNETLGKEKHNKYIYTCIENSIRDYQQILGRKKRDSSNDISMESTIHTTKNGDKLNLETVLEDPFENVEEKNMIISRNEKLREILKKISDKELWLLNEIYVNGKSLSEISRDINIPRSTLQKRFDKALMKLKHPNNMRWIKDFFTN